MMNNKFFPQRSQANPTIYAYELMGVSTHTGLLKVGYTDRNAKDRIAEQVKTSGVRYKIVLDESAMRPDGNAISDHDIHRYLRKQGIRNPHGEWFACTVAQVKAAILAVQTGQETDDNRTCTFGMRPEQTEAVEKTIAYFRSFRQENPTKTPHFLWNAKMRFGKTFASY